MKENILHDLELVSIEIAKNYYKNKPIKIEINVNRFKENIDSSIKVTEFIYKEQTKKSIALTNK